MFLKWLPWRFLIRRLARFHGFLDPVRLLANLEKLAQPSEVAVPLELLRAGMLFHARGLINTKVIQQNLDWVWPYWVQRQFDPQDPAFLPRAFSLTHVNLTHRNWTAVGTPGCDGYPIIDPRGLVTPFFDSWSLQAALFDQDGRSLLPALAEQADQQLDIEDGLAVRTRLQQDGLVLTSRVRVENPQHPTCRMSYSARCDHPVRLAVAVRPFNPEGVSFVNKIALQGRTLTVNGSSCVDFSDRPDRHVVSRYEQGDVLSRLDRADEQSDVNCKVGLATAAGLWELPAGGGDLDMTIDLLAEQSGSDATVQVHRPCTWAEAMEGVARLDVPDPTLQRLYDQAVHNLVLLSPADVYPGPYTYRRFWFRDAAFMMHAMAVAGMADRVETILQTFPDHQRATGYFHSQDGEWDSNGEVLWLLGRYTELTGRQLPQDPWRKVVTRAARWIERKRCDEKKDPLHNGLLPAGFSAEHFGNNDYYYWDDYWSLAGLRAAGRLCGQWGLDDSARTFDAWARELAEAIDRSLTRSRSRRDRDALPASPYRRMDAGAVGSLAGGYPLGLLDGDDPRLAETVRFLREECFVDGMFFQQMIHSGKNAYLTLHIAQVLLRAGQADARELIRAVADAASATGQWPEAIHPATGGGCMGDGQHGWALAEWVLMIRNCFIREEGDRLVLAAGVFPDWLDGDQPVRFGPSPTRFGPVRVQLQRLDERRVEITWQGDWRNPPADVVVAPPLVEKATTAPADTGQLIIEPQKGNT